MPSMAVRPLNLAPGIQEEGSIAAVVPDVPKKPDDETVAPGKICEKLRKAALKIQAKFINTTGRAIDYGGLEKSAEWQEQVALSRSLAQEGMVPEDLSERKAFFINLYNGLMMHGVIERRVAGEKEKHPIQEAKMTGKPVTFFGDVAYIVEGERLSLDDIEHGILRSNRKRPGHNERPFPDPADVRLKWALPDESFDPRIHFALVCGAKGCPPIQVYSGKNLDRGLELATKAFLNGETDINVEGGEATMLTSMLFNWYGADFGDNEEQRIEWISKFLNDDKLESLSAATTKKLDFKGYDWSLNQ